MRYNWRVPEKLIPIRRIFVKHYGLMDTVSGREVWSR